MTLLIIIFHTEHNVTLASTGNTTVYADGVWMGSHHDVESTTVIQIPGYTRILALTVTDSSDVTAFIASISNTLVSDTSWKCRSITTAHSIDVADWLRESYDDSHWSDAVSMGFNGDGIFKEFLDLEQRAQWIGLTTNDPLQCRKYICK